MSSLNSYQLSRCFFDWSFENPEKIKPNHIALYFFAIEHCNRLGWKERFGFPTTMAMEAIGVKSYNTFIKTLNDLAEYGFIKILEKSKNQYSANIIALSNNNNALDNALDKALGKHGTKQSESTVQSIGESIDSIDKPYNHITKEQLNIPPNPQGGNHNDLKKFKSDDNVDNSISGRTKSDQKVKEEKEALKMPEEFIPLWTEWQEYRKARKLKPYAAVKWEQIAVNKLLELSNKDPVKARKILEQTYQNNYQGFFELKQNGKQFTPQYTPGNSKINGSTKPFTIDDFIEPA